MSRLDERHGWMYHHNKQNIDKLIDQVVDQQTTAESVVEDIMSEVEEKIDSQLANKAVKAMQLYLGSVDKTNIKTQQRFYNKVSAIVDQIASKYGMDNKDVWDQVEQQAKKLGIHTVMPGKDF